MIVVYREGIETEKKGDEEKMKWCQVTSWVLTIKLDTPWRFWSIAQNIRVWLHFSFPVAFSSSRQYLLPRAAAHNYALIREVCRQLTSWISSPVCSIAPTIIYFDNVAVSTVNTASLTGLKCTSHKKQQIELYFLIVLYLVKKNLRSMQKQSFSWLLLT